MNKEQYDVAVVGGAGHVGLPLSLILADKGFKVCIYDKNQAALDVIGQGRMPFLEEGALDLLVRNLNSNLFLSSDPACLREAHFVIVVIGTPVDEHLNPEFTLMQKSFTELLPFLKDGQHVILRSTLFPGTAEKVYKFLQAHGLNIRVSFCPERILQGKSLQEIKELPQIISGFDAETIQEASELFKKIADEVIALEPIEAEIAKLMTNCWRYIQFATANQFYVIAADRGLDFYKIFEAVKYKYPRMNGLPSAGFAAGPCLLKDTMQLAAFSGNNFALGQSAMFINEGLPNFITQQLKHKHDLSNKTVGILGMAFKPNCDDKRESLSYKLKKIFTLESKEVLCSDVYIREEGFVPADELIRRSDIIILATPHKEYKALIDSIGNEKTLVDVWNFYGQGKKSQSMPKQKILVTGSAGFIAGYLIEELLNQGYEVVGIDNYSKYGPVEKSYDHHPNYHFVQGDVKDTDLMKKLISDCDQLVALAAMIGGISYFHEYAYDLLAENERIIASTFDAAIWAWRNKKLKKINVLSSSMVFENTDVYPTSEGEQKKCAPPSSTYGFQKLACEYFTRGAWEQYQLPYTIIRPFNCIGTGEKRAKNAKEIYSGNIKLAMSHVVPDLVLKILSGQDPLHILGSGNQIRHYTYGGDLARGIRLCLESDKAINEDFNLSTAVSTNVLELAQLIWQKVNGEKPFSYVSDKPFEYDVQSRVPSVTKAKDLLGFEATTSLGEALDEIIPWICEQMKLGGI